MRFSSGLTHNFKREDAFLRRLKIGQRVAVVGCIFLPDCIATVVAQSNGITAIEYDGHCVFYPYTIRKDQNLIITVIR